MKKKQSTQTAHTRALARTMPTQVVKYIGDISRRFRLTFPETVFIALRKLDWPAADAYLAVRPHVKRRSACETGSRWNARLESAITDLSVDDALLAMSDWAVTRGMVHPSAETAVKAATEFNRTRGRHHVAEPEAPSGLAMLLALVKGGEGGGGGPPGVDGPPCADTPIPLNGDETPSQDDAAVVDVEFEVKGEDPCEE